MSEPTENEKLDTGADEDKDAEAEAKAQAAALADQLDQREVVIDGTTYRIEKLLPMEAYRVLEVMRRVAGPILAGLPKGSSVGVILGRIMGQVPPETVETVRVALFKNVRFSNDRTKQTFRPLHPDEAMAFSDPVHVYEILVRAMAVNFTASFRAAASRFQETTSISGRPLTET